MEDLEINKKNCSILFLKDSFYRAGYIIYRGDRWIEEEDQGSRKKQYRNNLIMYYETNIIVYFIDRYWMKDEILLENIPFNIKKIYFIGREKEYSDWSINYFEIFTNFKKLLKLPFGCILLYVNSFNEIAELKYLDRTKKYIMYNLVD